MSDRVEGEVVEIEIEQNRRDEMILVVEETETEQKISEENIIRKRMSYDHGCISTHCVHIIGTNYYVNSYHPNHLHHQSS